MARPRDELPPRVEQALDVVGHRVEGGAELAQLLRAALGGARGEVTRGDPRGRVLQRLDPPCDRRADEHGRHDRRQRGQRRDLEDLHVVAHVEHHEPGEEHRAERKRDRDERQPRELEAERRQQPQEVRRDEARSERRRPTTRPSSVTPPGTSL